MEGISDTLNSVRGFNMSVQAVVQSLSQWQEKYPDKQWENQLATFDQVLYMGCNDLTSAKYISEKCGKVTISVTNNQMPLMPLFSPVYTSTRPYSQTRSNTQRDLMQPDEVLRLDNRKCIALFRSQKPALLYKLAPEELTDFGTLKSCRIIDYIPAWRQKEMEQAAAKDMASEKRKSEPQRTKPDAEDDAPKAEPAQQAAVSPERKGSSDRQYTLIHPHSAAGTPDDKSDLGMVEHPGGVVETSPAAVCGGNDEDEDDLELEYRDR
jgi:type IV secretion system protein VirD4